MIAEMLQDPIGAVRDDAPVEVCVRIQNNEHLPGSSFCRVIERTAFAENFSAGMADHNFGGGEFALPVFEQPLKSAGPDIVARRKRNKETDFWSAAFHFKNVF